MYLDVRWRISFPTGPSLSVSGPLFIACRLCPAQISSRSVNFSSLTILFSSQLLRSSTFILYPYPEHILLPTSFALPLTSPSADRFAPALTFLVAIFSKPSTIAVKDGPLAPESLSSWSACIIFHRVRCDECHLNAYDTRRKLEQVSQ